MTNLRSYQFILVTPFFCGPSENRLPSINENLRLKSYSQNGEILLN